MLLFCKVGHQTVLRLRELLVTHTPYAAYGLTEMSAAAHVVPHDRFLSKAGSVGVLLPNLEARLVGDDGADVKPGEPGELWLRGPTVMKVYGCVRVVHSNGPDRLRAQGYLNNPTATKESISADGWYKTGDVCTRDAEGCYYVMDRIKELIKYKVWNHIFLNNLSFNHLFILRASKVLLYT